MNLKIICRWRLWKKVLPEKPYPEHKPFQHPVLCIPFFDWLCPLILKAAIGRVPRVALLRLSNNRVCRHFLNEKQRLGRLRENLREGDALTNLYEVFFLSQLRNNRDKFANFVAVSTGYPQPCLPKLK